MREIYFITGNKGKLLEAEKKLSDLDVRIIQKNIGYPEIQADTLEEVAEFGVQYLVDKVKDTFILEDAGLFIDALKGFPGVYSAYVYKTIGFNGILKLMEGIRDRGAVFRSVYAYKEPDSPALFFIGECRGAIATKNRGSNGFGFDPIFIPSGSTRTFAEMSTEEKNSFSHRGKALEKLYDFLENRIKLA
ncbi:MAG: non-canonical purine NTP pyrophosphatase, RdgB/HAM1 family [Thermoplasmata archaeon]|nr:MAG: non-canonical purine NTP pyrophosphatase, RdgB/HAM1 family [Thermoplasmata archaeon]